MKKIILSLAVALISTSLSAQKQSTEIKVSQLPQTTQNYIRDNLPGCQIVKAVKEVEKGKVTYNVGVDVKGKNKFFIFDGSGAFLKRAEKEAETSVTTVKQGNETKVVQPGTTIEGKDSIKQKDAQRANETKVQTAPQPKKAQPASSGGVNPPTEKKVAQPTGTGVQSTQQKTTAPASTGGVKQPTEKKVAQPTGTGVKSTQQKTTTPASTGGTKPVAKPASVQPATSGNVQQTGSKEVKSTGTVPDKKPAQPGGTTDTIKKKK